MQGYLIDENLDKVKKFKDSAAENGLTVVQLALAWILQHKEISSVIIGAPRPEQIEENVKAVGVTLDESTMNDIERIL